MIWFFERSDEEISVEVSYDGSTSEYVLTVGSRDGTHVVERFADAVSFKARLVELERTFDERGWSRRGHLLIDDGRMRH